MAEIGEGAPEPLGVTADGTGVNVAVVAPDATAVEFCLFDATRDTQLACYRLPARSGDVWHGHVAGIGPGARYGLRAHGPWEPGAGHVFDPSKLLLDPWARRIDRPFRLHESQFARGADSAPCVPKAVIPVPGHPAPPPPPAPGPRVIYEMHVRGFTRLHPAIPEEIRGSFAALGHPAAIAHLRTLGITHVELMPIAAGIDERHLPPLGLNNHWNYNPVGFLAPDPRLAPGGTEEVRAATAALRAAGIGVILDVVYNHSGEGDEHGPTLSLRGLANRAFHRFGPDGRYANDAGCGNTLALDRPWPLRLAMDAMRHWVLEAGVEGFRLDLAVTLGRRDTGFDPHAPLLAAMRQDPLLRERIIIAEPWDVGWGGYQLGAFPPGWGEWNDRFRDTVRRFWRGDAGQVPDIATRLAGSADLFGPARRRASDSINYVTSHDGFTLADLVTFTEKRNLANGEHGHDGHNENHSWNCGVEGPTDDPAVLARRAGDVRALLATLLAARGTPMLSMGDECGRSQGGNNNAYAQDNPVSWFDWAGMDQQLLEFAARLVALRRAHPALHADRPLTGEALDAAGLPDVAWRRPDGAAFGPADWADPAQRSLVAVFYVPARGGAAGGPRAGRAAWCGGGRRPGAARAASRLCLAGAGGQRRSGPHWRRRRDAGTGAAQRAAVGGGTGTGLIAGHAAPRGEASLRTVQGIRDCSLPHVPFGPRLRHGARDEARGESYAEPESDLAAGRPYVTGTLVSLRGVAKRYATGTLAVQGIDLDIEQGDFLALLGPSGCGKSTLLRMIARLSAATAGRIDWPGGRPDTRDIGFVFQEPTLMPWATALANVALPLELAGVPRREAAGRAAESLARVDLKGFERAYPRALSGGMRMRVSIARALVTRPRLLLMDEPFAALDEITRFRLNNDLLALWEAERFTVVFVTHSVFESVYLARRIAVMAPRPGRIHAELPVEASYPRGEEFRTSADYAARCREVSHALEQAMAAQAA